MTGFPLLLLLLFWATGVLTAALPQLGGVAFILGVLCAVTWFIRRHNAKPE